MRKGVIVVTSTIALQAECPSNYELAEYDIFVDSGMQRATKSDSVRAFLAGFFGLSLRRPLAEEALEVGLGGVGSGSGGGGLEKIA